MKIKLFDTRPTWPQKGIIGFWTLNIALVVALWLTTSEFSGGLAIILDAVGMLFGLLATYFALTQFMLMGRIAWIERAFGLDRLASYHRINGYLTITCIMIHPVLITISYSMQSHINLVRQYVDLILHFNYVWLGLVAQILFIAVVISSIYIARKRLKFESWYFVHLSVYAAIIIVPLHQLAIGDSFAGNAHPLARLYWLSLYAFTGINILIWRFGISTANLIRFGFRVSEVVAETPTTTSVYIHGRNLARWRAKPGQFVMIRIFAKGFWWQEHPFSLSAMPDDDQFRITIRHVGDYTAMIAALQPHKLVLVSGPFGRFTEAVAQTKKRLFIAGGVGITPIRVLAEQAISEHFDSTLLYANTSQGEVIFKRELNRLKQRGLHLISIYSHADPSYRGEVGHVNLAHIKRLVSDYMERDIYLCGPPSMMNALINELITVGFDERQLHYERFALTSS